MANFRSPFDFFSQGLQAGTGLSDAFNRSASVRGNIQGQQQQQQFQQQQAEQGQARFDQQFTEGQRQFDISSGQKQAGINLQRKQLEQKDQDFQQQRAFQTAVSTQLQNGSVSTSSLFEQFPERYEEIQGLQEHQQKLVDMEGEKAYGQLFTALKQGDVGRAQGIIVNNAQSINDIAGGDVAGDYLKMARDSPADLMADARTAYVLSGGDIKKLGIDPKQELSPEQESEKFNKLLEQQTATKNYSETLGNSLKTVNEFLDNPSRIAGVTGLSQYRGAIPGTQISSDISEIGSIKGVLESAAIKDLKDRLGPGIGRFMDSEVQAATRSIANLESGRLTPNAFKNNLEQAKRHLTNIQDMATQQSEVLTQQLKTYPQSEKLPQGVSGGEQQPQSTAPPQALEYLKQNPDAMDQFEAKYGYRPQIDRTFNPASQRPQ